MTGEGALGRSPEQVMDAAAVAALFTSANRWMLTLGVRGAPLGARTIIDVGR